MGKERLHSPQRKFELLHPDADGRRCIFYTIASVFRDMEGSRRHLEELFHFRRHCDDVLFFLLAIISCSHRLGDHRLHRIRRHWFCQGSIAPEIFNICVFLQHEAHHQRSRTAWHETERRLLQFIPDIRNRDAACFAGKPFLDQILHLFLDLNDRKAGELRSLPVVRHLPCPFQCHLEALFIAALVCP